MAHSDGMDLHIAPVKSLPEQIKDAILAKIVAGELEPGARLVELQIARSLNTSQGPVREALKDLEALGVVELRRNKGAVVREMDAQEVADTYAVRGALEGLAAQRVAETQPQLGRAFLKSCDEMEAASAEGDMARFSELNHLFHSDIVGAACNSVLHESWERLDIRSRTILNLHRATPDFDAIHKAHRAIARAIAEGDGALARKLLEDHALDVLAG
ncbi:GntR family transcriptional regulator [Roseobacteraceae bacterium S113]